MDKPTLLKLKSDKEFHDNMLSARADPFVTWKIMKKKLNLEFNDLTFENFEIIDTDVSTLLDKLEADNS